MKPTNIRLRQRFQEGAPAREVSDADYDILVTGNVDMYKPDGSRLLCFRKGALSWDAVDRARPVLRKTSHYKSFNRGTAAGSPGIHVVKKDGTLSNTSRSLEGVHSAILGYFDRYPRFPYCRETAFSIELAQEMADVRPLLSEAREVFRDAVPERYAAQMDWVYRTNPDFVLQDTPWTTITVNYNWQTRLHTDKGDLNEGFSCITALTQGDYRGGLLVFPAFRVAADLRSGDMLMMDAHEYHANTPMVGEGERISCVLYYRTKMTECGTVAEELERAKALRGSIPTTDDDQDQNTAPES